MTFRPVARRFFDRPVLVVARDLLGCLLVHGSPEGMTTGRIVEVEAYGADDPGCHAFRGRTNRNAPMFETPGIAYIYFTYGMHWCLNAVCESVGSPAAALIRAVEPIEGIDLMRIRRGGVRDRDLCRGPARLTQAFGIDGSFNRVDLTTKPFFVAPGERLPHEAVATGPRVGLGQTQDGRAWRFSVAASPFVSAFKP